MSDFEKELYEQPDVITRLLTEESERARLLAADMRRRGVQYVMVAAALPIMPASMASTCSPR